jgi:dienelactone hydrolase
MIQRRYLTLIIVLTIFSGSAYYASQFGNDFGGVSVQTVTIEGSGYDISGVLYTPKILTGKFPAFALAHGVSNSKEVLSGVALELAKNGYVALTIDEKGHGESDSGLGVSDPTLGLGSAVTYLKSLPYVDFNRIGVAGHSMGAGSVRAVISSNLDIAETILIGGGQGDDVYKPMNKTQPRNLLFIVGKNDVLFDLKSLDTYLRPVFGTMNSIAPGTVYGWFGNGTARKLVVLDTIHLLEPIDPATVHEIVEWANSVLYPEVSYPLTVKTQTYLFREGLMLISLISFVALIIPLSQVLNHLLPGSLVDAMQVRHRFLRERRVLLLWSLLGLLLFLPTMFLGVIIPFPPLIFGASMAWWFLMTGIAGLIILAIIVKRQFGGNMKIWGHLIGSFRVRDAALGVVIATILYALAHALVAMFGEKLRFIVPIFPPLIANRAQILPLFIPFYLIYFAVESLYLHVYRERQMAGSAAGNLMRTILLKLTPYLAILTVQYLPMYVANYRLLPSSIGFFIEFIWAILPLLLISTFTSWWLYRYTGRIWAGIVLNTLLFAWASAGLFPFTAFR